MEKAHKYHFFRYDSYAGITQIRCGRSLHFLSDCTQTPIYRTMIAQSSANVKVGAWTHYFSTISEANNHQSAKLPFRSQQILHSTDILCLACG